MERSIFKNCSELSEFMIDRAQDGYYVVAALYYNETKDLLRELLLYEDVDTELIEIEPVENNGYDKEYYVALTDNMIVTVERAYKYGRYLQTDADLLLIDNEANSKIVADLDQKKCREIYIGDKPEVPFTDYNEYNFGDIDSDSWYDLFDKARLYKDASGNVVGIAIGLIC